MMPHTLPRFRMSSLTETLSAKDSIFAQPVIHSDTQGLLLILRTTDKLCAAQCVPSGSKAEVMKCKDFGSRGVLRTFPEPEDKVFSTLFQYKIMRKGGAFDKCKVHLVVQGQRTKRKGADGVGDYDDAFSLVPAASGFRTF